MNVSVSSIREFDRSSILIAFYLSLSGGFLGMGQTSCVYAGVTQAVWRKSELVVGLIDLFILQYLWVAFAFAWEWCRRGFASVRGAFERVLSASECFGWTGYWMVLRESWSSCSMDWRVIAWLMHYLDWMRRSCRFYFPWLLCEWVWCLWTWCWRGGGHREFVKTSRSDWSFQLCRNRWGPEFELGFLMFWWLIS